jgi:hypothetical protein
VSVAAVRNGRVALWLVSVLIAFALDGVAAVRVWRAGPERFRFGKWYKAGWLIVDIWVVWHLGAVVIPIGVVLALSRTWTPPAPPGENGPIPFADGDGWPEGWA